MNNIGKTKDKIGYTMALFKIIIAACLLCWLFWTGKIDFSVLFDLNTGRFHFSIWYFSVLLVPASLCLLAYRWQQFLTLQQIHIGFFTSLRLTLIANFFMVALPGMIGGDIIKTIYVCKNINNRRVNAVSATLADRVLGTYALFAVGAVASFCVYFFYPFIGIETKDTLILNKVILIPPILFGVTTIVLATALNQSLYNRVIRPLLNRVPAGNHLNRIFETMNMYRQYLGKVLYLISISALNHVLNIILIMCVAQALHDPLRPFIHFLLNAIAITGNLVPITPGGIGLTEGVFHYIYSLAGSNYGATVGLTARLLNYVMFIGLGLPVYISMRSHFDVKIVTEQSKISLGR